MRNLVNLVVLCLVISTVSQLAEGSTLALQTTPSEESGNAVLVPVHIETSPSEPVASLQFDLRFDPQTLKFSGIAPGAIAQDADKSAYANLMHPGLVRVIIAGLNRTTMGTGILVQIRFTATAPSFNTTTVTMETAILSDPYGSSVSVTLSPNTVMLEQTGGRLQASMVTGTASPKNSTGSDGTYRALFVALLCVVAAMTWSRHSSKKRHQR